MRTEEYPTHTIRVARDVWEKFKEQKGNKTWNRYIMEKTEPRSTKKR